MTRPQVLALVVLGLLFLVAAVILMIQVLGAPGGVEFGEPPG